MAIVSMTGFSRVDGAGSGIAWFWEARSVNGRGLDLRFRLPPGYESLEVAAREAAIKRFGRGNIGITLSVRRDAKDVEMRLNEHVLARVIDAAERIRKMTNGEAIRPEGILAVKGVLEAVEPDDTSAEAGNREAMVTGLAAALDGLVAARAEEGSRLASVLGEQLARITALVETIRAAPARRPENIRAKLALEIARILESADGLDPARLHQEAMLIATRADIEEEIVRLEGHLVAARDLLKMPGPIGRRFDFLAQEFNREANTICAKSNDGDITRAGLDLKVVVDQLREQIQNIE